MPDQRAKNPSFFIVCFKQSNVPLYKTFFSADDIVSPYICILTFIVSTGMVKISAVHPAKAPVINLAQIGKSLTGVLPPYPLLLEWLICFY